MPYGPNVLVSGYLSTDFGLLAPSYLAPLRSPGFELDRIGKPMTSRH